VYNTEVQLGVKLAGTLRARTLAVNSNAATPLSSTSLRILWVIVKNVGSVTVYIGGSDVDKTGDNTGMECRPQGETPPIPVRDLSQVFVISASATPNVSYLAGIAPALDSDDSS
jgi:hypothetical protein